jgi:hypothetical protein
MPWLPGGFFWFWRPAIGCAVIPRFAWSEPIPNLAVFTRENSDLTDDRVWALAFSTDGFLWAGTFAGGLSRLDRDGHWQTYGQANTNGGLPADDVSALALAPFTKSGDPRYFWTERLTERTEEIALTCPQIGEPLLIHAEPNAEPGRPYGVCTLLIPALGEPDAQRRRGQGPALVARPQGRPFSTCALAFSESWTEAW